MLVAAFPSPATIAPYGASIPGSTFPACCFANLHQLFPPPVRLFGSTTLDRFAPGSGPLHCLKPVAASTAGSLNRAANLHSPSGFLGPSGSKRSTDFAAHRPAFRIRPISSRSPPPFSIASVSAADHRSRSATFPEACCSSRRPSGLRKTKSRVNSLAHRTTWLRSDLSH